MIPLSVQLLLRQLPSSELPHRIVAKLYRNKSYQLASSMSVIMPADRVPALFIKTSACPNLPLTFSHRDATDFGSDKSVGTVTTSIALLMALISFLTSASASDERATSTMPFGTASANDFANPLVC